MDKLLKHALNYHKNGFKVIFTDDNKQPAVGAWAKYRSQQSASDIQSMYDNNKAKIKGLAVLCTDGMEVIDIDQKYSLDGSLMVDYFAAISEQIGEENFMNLTISLTKSGGAHLIYRTDIGQGNQKLASRPTTPEEGAGTRVLLETRGKGGYIVVPPTDGYQFDIVSPEGFAPKISDEWRNIFINTARSFDELDTNHQTKTVAPTPPSVQGAHLTTIEAFNENHTAFELLEAAGWQFAYTRGENDYLVRPGKKKRDGISAGYNNSKRLAYIFTTSSEFDGDRAYNAFQVYSVLNHNGDYSAAAKELYRAGYGERLSKTQDTEQQKTKAVLGENKEDFGKAVAMDDMERIYSQNRFSIRKKPKFVSYCLTYRDKVQKVFNVGAFGDLITITGAAKSRKSALGSSMVASALGGVEVLGFTLDNATGRDIAYIDTEQTEAEHYKVQSRVYSQAGISKDPNNYFAFTVGEESRINMLAFIAYLVKKHPNLGVLFIDGIVDLCEDYNDLKKASELVGFIKKIANKNNILIINVLHNARSTGDARGHLGTELINKSKAVIQVTKDQESGDSTVNFKYLREQSPDDFDFTHDSNGNLVLI